MKNFLNTNICSKIFQKKFYGSQNEKVVDKMKDE